jgi:hypothetical protein
MFALRRQSVVFHHFGNFWLVWMMGLLGKTVEKCLKLKITPLKHSGFRIAESIGGPAP